MLRVLNTGEHAGFKWIVKSNYIAARCGYVCVPEGHPWYGDVCGDIYSKIKVHGGVTWANNYVPGRDVVDGEWWIGFDCSGPNDVPDPDLVDSSEIGIAISKVIWRGTVKSQEYAENECKSLCEQAKAALLNKG